MTIVGTRPEIIRLAEVIKKCDEIIEYFISRENLELVDIPVGYTHNIENLRTNDMVTIMCCNECFNPQNPYTTLLEV